MIDRYVLREIFGIFGRMSSLYRRYRPALFGDLVGQETLATMLKKAIESDKVAHAYLFSGPRGSGKTTVARLLAKAINCLDRSMAEPCQKCSICLEIAASSLSDIIEIDAASNRGIDEIRAIRDTVGFAPMRSTYKVYIIDEAHMLTKEAFNALLKTLEEPPKHAVFILATTELHKVPETIISRCLRFAFRPATISQLLALLKKVAAAEKLTVEPAALAVIADRAAGSFRDGLTILASLAGAASGEPITAESVRLAIGLPAERLIQELYSNLLEGKVVALTSRLKEIIQEGGQLSVVLTGLIRRAQSELLAEGELADSVGKEPLVNLLERLVAVEWRSKQALESGPAIVAGLVGISLANRPVAVETPPGEKPISPPRSTNDSAESALVRDLQPPTASETKETSERIDSLTEGLPDQSDFWLRLLAAVKEKNHALYAVVGSTRLTGLTEEKILLEVKFRFWAERLYEKRNRALIEQLAADLTGRRRSLECQIVPSPTAILGATEESDDLVKTVVEVFEIKADG